MKRIMLSGVLLTIALISGCQKKSQDSQRSGNFKVENLFTVDGCTVYRFEDDRSVYFTNCKGSTLFLESCGDNCIQTDTVSGGKH